MAMQSVADSQPTRSGVIASFVAVQAPAPPAGSVEVRTVPALSETRQNEAEGQEMPPSRPPSPAVGAILCQEEITAGVVE